MALNSSIKTVTGISPNELDKGQKLREIPDLNRACNGYFSQRNKKWNDYK